MNIFKVLCSVAVFLLPGGCAILGVAALYRKWDARRRLPANAISEEVKA